jgi:hypothetical protein
MPLLVLAGGAFAGGLVAASLHEPEERRLATSFADAWEREDYAEMYAMLSPASQQATPVRRFARNYRRARATATVTALRIDDPRQPRDNAVEVPVSVRTRVFGDLRQSVTLPIVEGQDGEPAVAWAPHMTFPGVRAGE